MNLHGHQQSTRHYNAPPRPIQLSPQNTPPLNSVVRHKNKIPGAVYPWREINVGQKPRRSSGSQRDPKVDAIEWT